MIHNLTDKAAELLRYIEDGWEIHYAPVSGGIITYLPRESRWAQAPFNAFSQLRAAGLIQLIRTMRQGHQQFHGRVDIYARFVINQLR